VRAELLQKSAIKARILGREVESLAKLDAGRFRLGTHLLRHLPQIDVERGWPPFMASADAHEMGTWTVITRDDGSKQWAYKGKPLYNWKDDKKAGDVDGDGRNNVWRIAVP
jgi:hypothetical protein